MFNKTNYYYLISSFPSLKMGEQAELSFKEVKEMLPLNLNKRDQLKVEQLLLSIDLSNIRSLWLGLPLDERGNLSAKDLEEALLVQDSLPSFVIEYLERYELVEDRLRFYPSLYASLYRNMSDMSGLVARIYQFERELRLVLTALRAKRGGRDLIRELQFEDPTDPFVAEIIAQKDAADYVPPLEFETVKNIFLGAILEPQRLHMAILEYRFMRIQEMVDLQDFSIDRVLAYMLQLLIVESWTNLNKSQGMKLVEKYGQ